jgi:TorA maturation chaperone TorD
MTSASTTLDLVDQAATRARLAALLGRLLAGEPGPDLEPLVAGVEALAPLATGGCSLAADYERLLLREVPVYESVFLDADGQRGGPTASAVSATYESLGFDETGAWRVAGPDHLGLELRCYAHLCAEEAAGWHSDQPDRAARAVEAARGFLAAHLGAWGEVAMEAVRRRAGASPYAEVAAAVTSFLASEAERLRPDPDHPGLGPVDLDRTPVRMGPHRLARWLLAPACSGAYLDTQDLEAAALALGIPWRASDPRSRFGQVVEDASSGGDLDVLLAALRPAIERWRQFHAEREATRSGDSRTWRAWRLRTERTLEVVDRTADLAGADGADDATRDVLATTVQALRALDGDLAREARRILSQLLDGEVGA